MTGGNSQCKTAFHHICKRQYPRIKPLNKSAYLLILDSYDRGDFAQVETRVYSFSDLSGGQAYWLAKAFLVLGDSFVDRGDYSQAMATFESIRDGYSAPEGGDDVADNVSLRIRKLEEIMQREAAEK